MASLSLLVMAVTGCSDGSPACEPQGLLDEPQTEQDVLAADQLEIVSNVDESTTRLLADLGDEAVSFYLGASDEGGICLLIVAESPMAGCSGGGGAGLRVSDQRHTVGLVAENDEDAVPSGATTAPVPNGCLAVRYR